MPRINVLPKEIAELIAAGEVIDRPASVIKELVENSIDSGAKSITTEIQNGGVTLIRVTDDGCGFLREDIKNAFLRHATSKILTSDDLYTIGTLGFRGEALPSICAMAKVELITKTEDEDIGTKYEISADYKSELEEAGCPSGTTIIVRDIFYNTPARMKFLKKDVTEGNAVYSVVEKLAISHPNVSIKFIRDGKIKLHTVGDGNLLSVIQKVYGKDFAKSLIPVDYNSGEISVKGFVSKPTNCQATRRMQNFYINGRFVKTTTAMAALQEAYKHSIMVGKFPGCVLNIEMPLYDVDVNVHPSKIEVRFANEKPVFSAVYGGVKDALSKIDLSKKDGINPKKKLTLSEIYKKEEILEQTKIDEKTQEEIVTIKTIPKMKGFFSGRIANSFEKNFGKQQKEEKDVYEIPVHNIKNTLLSAFDTNADNDIKQLFKNKEEEFTSKCIDIVADDKYEKNDTENKEYKAKENTSQPKTRVLTKPKEKTKSEKEPIKKEIKKKSRFEGYSFVGELFETYIIMQNETNTIIVDKHAAHERLIFNRIRKEFLEGNITKQVLLSPITLRLSTLQHEIAMENIDKVCKFGFTVEDFGDETIIIREIPLFLTQENSKSVIIDIIENIISYKSDIMPEEIDNLLHSISCKSAIKANDKNQTEELLKLIDDLDENEDVNFCPHGRPIMKTLSKYEIEKKFGRA